MLTGEIKLLDPSANSSRVRIGDFEIDGPYFPLLDACKGDRVTVCVRPEQVTVAARNGRPKPNQIPVELRRTVERPHFVRLEFVTPAGEAVAADLSRAEDDRHSDNRDWAVEFLRESLRVVTGGSDPSAI